MRVSRYAPSPTGPLHLGNVRTALLAWLQARLAGGRFILRMEDLDLPRVRPDSDRQIMDDLQWLGLDWDAGPGVDNGVGEYYQSKRTHLYQDALNSLYEHDRIYPCYCSRKDIREAASAPHGRMPIYPGICQGKYPQVTPGNEMPIDGRLPAWRFRVCDQTIVFYDVLKGRVDQSLAAEVGDFVLRRSDGLFAYQLAVVVDDMDMEITDVLRGEDLLDSTCRQIALIKALGGTPPEFWHVELMKNEQGYRMAKRDGSNSLRQFREQGVNASELIGQLAFGCGLVDRQLPLDATSLLDTIERIENFKCLLRAY